MRNRNRDRDWCVRWVAGTTAVIPGVGLALAPRAGAGPVAACGAVVQHGDVGELVADLACPGGGVVLENGAVLRLNGHVLSGPGGGSGACLFPVCGGVWCQGT